MELGLLFFFLLLSGTGCLDDLRKEMDGAWFGSLLLRHLFGSELALFFCMMLVLVILNIPISSDLARMPFDME